MNTVSVVAVVAAAVILSGVAGLIGGFVFARWTIRHQPVYWWATITTDETTANQLNADGTQTLVPNGPGFYQVTATGHADSIGAAWATIRELPGQVSHVNVTPIHS